MTRDEPDDSLGEPVQRHASLLISNLPTHSSTVEAYRRLRTSVAFAARDHGFRTFLVTSAGRGEGKSVTSANLALSLADLGQRVLLLDCDLRLPSLAGLFGLGPNATSLADVVGPRGKLRVGVFRSGLVEVAPKLHLFRAAPAAIEYPAEFLESSALDVILDRAREEYQYIIVDSPPAGLVTDATVLARRMDAVLFVLAHGQTGRRFVKRSIRELERADATMLGVVLNRFPSKGGRSFNPTGALGGEYYAVTGKHS